MILTVHAKGWARPYPVGCPTCDQQVTATRTVWDDPAPEPGGRTRYDVWVTECPDGHQHKTTDTLSVWIKRHGLENATLTITHAEPDTATTPVEAPVSPQPSLTGLARLTDPDTSQHAADLPREGRRGEAVEALADLGGTGTAEDVARWVNSDPERSSTTSNNVARRLRELADQGHVQEDGRTLSASGARQIVWRLTHQQAAA